MKENYCLHRYFDTAIITKMEVHLGYKLNRRSGSSHENSSNTAGHVNFNHETGG